MKQLRVFAIATVAALMLLAMTGPAPADLGLDVSPAKLELSMAPGTNYNIPVTVHNGAGDGTHVVATMVDFGLTQNGDYRFEKPGTRPYSLLRWASINPREFDLPSQTTQQVRLSLALPSNPGLSGEYAGIVFFQTRPVRRGAHAVAISARVGSKFYLTIPGTVKIDGAITKMTATKGTGGELYRVLFRNTGNAHVYLRGQLQVRRGGQTIENIAMPSELLVERGGTRLVEVTGKALPPGKYDAIALVDYGGKAMTGGEIAFERR